MRCRRVDERKGLDRSIAKGLFVCIKDNIGRRAGCKWGETVSVCERREGCKYVCVGRGAVNVWVSVWVKNRAERSRNRSRHNRSSSRTP